MNNVVVLPAANGFNEVASATDGPPEGVELRLLGPDDAEAVAELRARAFDRPLEPYCCGPRERPFIAAYLGLVGETFGVISRRRLVAVGALGLPGRSDRCRADTLGLGVTDRRYVCHLAGTAVLPGHRARGLHRWLICRRLDYALHRGRRHAVALVPVSNHVAWRHLIDHGLSIRRLGSSADAPYLLHRDVARRRIYDTDGDVICQPRDLMRQRRLLAEGYAGYRWMMIDGVPHIVYGRPVQGSA